MWLQRGPALLQLMRVFGRTQRVAHGCISAQLTLSDSLYITFVETLDGSCSLASSVKVCVLSGIDYKPFQHLVHS